MDTDEKEIKGIGVTKNVLVVSLVSLFQDASSEIIYPLLPLFLCSVLGVNKALYGLIEGVAESTASLFKVFSGWISDRIGKRKSIVFAGYLLSAASKPLLALVTTWWQAFFLRFSDRVGKGVRGAPRDALIADSTSVQSRGRAFGFHRGMDTLGAVIGPLLAFALLKWLNNDFRKVFMLAAIPAFISVALVFFIRERKHFLLAGGPPRLTLKGFSSRFKIFLFILTFFALGNSSDGFLILRAQNLGLPALLIPLIYLVFNLVYALVALPAGIISDRIGRKPALILGYLVFALVYFSLSLKLGLSLVWVLFGVYGLYRGMTDGVERAFIVDLVPDERRGTALGLYQTFVGLALLPASFIGGVLWDTVGPFATFLLGAATASLSALILALFI